MKKNWKRIVAVIIIIAMAFSMGFITAGAAGFWKGSEVVSNTNKNLSKIESTIEVYKEQSDKIDELANTISKKDSLIEDLEERLDEASGKFKEENGKLIQTNLLLQDYANRIAELESEIELLKQQNKELQQTEDYAYEDVLQIDSRVSEILEKIEGEK